MPWHRQTPEHVVGVLAREQEARSPGRLVSSARSWLCHGGVDRTADLLPELSRFYGIVVSMYYDDHPPPHFRAKYGSERAEFGIDPPGLLKGQLKMESCAIVTDVRPMGGFRLELTFSDGQQGVVDLSGRILGRRGDFQALADTAYFQQVRVDPELGTIVWPNDVDLSPDMLLDWVAAGRVPGIDTDLC